MSKRKKETTGFDELANALEVPPDIAWIPSEIRDRLEKIQSTVGEEYNITRDVLVDIMKIGGEALTDIHSLARQTQGPYYFEVMASLMKVMVEAQRTMMENKKIEQKINDESIKSPEQLPNSTTNVLVQCTPSQLLDMFEKSKA